VKLPKLSTTWGAVCAVGCGLLSYVAGTLVYEKFGVMVFLALAGTVLAVCGAVARQDAITNENYKVAQEKYAPDVSTQNVLADNAE
jgi:hypothetical protein